MKNEIIIFNSNELAHHIEVRMDEEKETFWLALNQIASLFERDKSVISRHIKNIFSNAELDKNSVVAFFAITAADGKIYNVEHFNLDVIPLCRLSRKFKKRYSVSHLGESRFEGLPPERICGQ
jgi:hypothetical protein